MNTPSLTDRAISVLRGNDTGVFTKPGPHQYPHQWNWDSALIALGLSHFDLPRSQMEIRSLLSGQWQDGMLPHVVYHQIPSDYFPPASFWQIESSPYAPDSPTSGITQPPLLATVIRQIHSRQPMPDFLQEIYSALLRWHRWLHTARDADGSGLVCIIHPWESGTDDSPRWLDVLAAIQPENIPEFQRGDIRHVPALERPHRADYERFIYLIDVFRKLKYDPEALLAQSPFLVQDVLFNTILYRADEDLRALAIDLGQPTGEIDGWLNRMRSNFDARFWDETRGIYYDYNVRAGEPIRVNTAATFLPLFAGLASKDQAQRLVEELLLEPHEYAPSGEIRHWVTTTARTEPTWEPRRYWRGPVWVILNWFLIEGLRRYAYNDLAEVIRQDTLNLMNNAGFREYYDAGDGSGCGSERFSWSAALALELVDPSMQANEPLMDRICSLLCFLYGDQIGRQACQQVAGLLDAYRARIPAPQRASLDQRDAILITYADQVLADGVAPLESLVDFCNRHLTGVVSGVHVLPFYPWSSDDGFSVVDYRAVKAEYGSWEDLSALEREFRLMFDAVINHISVESEWFQGFLRGDPNYQDYFIVVEGDPDLSKVVRPRALPLLTRFDTRQGQKAVWTTFSTDQVDLNYKNPNVLLEILDLLLYYASHGAALIRLDAIAYLWKEIGTSCIHLPQTHAIIQLFRAVLDEVAPHVDLITETNVPHKDNISYFGDGSNEAHLVYNFSLPPLVLHALHTGSAQTLAEWAVSQELPSEQVTFFNFLASHDGIGLNPLRGILSESEITALVDRVREHGGLVSYKSNPDGTQSPYELNVNYFDALNDPSSPESSELQVDRFLAAHAVLLAFRGVPGIYFHSLFGSRGWPQGVQETSRSRSINRQKLDLTQVESEFANPASRRTRVFQRMAHLLRIRATQPAFHPYGRQRVLEWDPAIFGLIRTAPGGGEGVLCLQNMTPRARHLDIDLEKIGFPVSRSVPDLVTGQPYPLDARIPFAPYQTLWLVF